MSSTVSNLSNSFVAQLIQPLWSATQLIYLGILVATAALVTWLFFFVVAPVPRRSFPSEKKFTSLDEDGRETVPTALPCWLDQLEKSRRKLREIGRSSKLNVPIEPADVFMTVVVPAYNEQERLVGMLEEAVNYLEHEYGTLNEKAEWAASENGIPVRRRPSGRTEINGNFSRDSYSEPLQNWEILLIDDGSADYTVSTALDFARNHQLPLRPRRNTGPWTSGADHAVNIPPGSIRIVSLRQNRGKGGAVIHGMRHARGQYVVFADADGASKFDDLGKLVRACQKLEKHETLGLNDRETASNEAEWNRYHHLCHDHSRKAIAVGSRAHLVGSEAVVQRSRLRNFLMHSFHLLLKLLTPPATAKIKDTQCGFKLFSRASLPDIIPYMHSEGWIFDVEMLMLAEFAGIPVVEVPVGWREVGGSKLNVLWDSLGMAWGLALLRICWGLGIYRRE